MRKLPRGVPGANEKEVKKGGNEEGMRKDPLRHQEEEWAAASISVGP